MFASGPVILSAMFLIQAEAQFEAGARIETRVGEMPTGTAQGTSSSSTVQPATVEQTQVMVVATPLLSLRWLDSIDDLRANSATRILWRPVPLLDSRPLFLENLEASGTRRPSKRSQWQFRIQGSYGEQDYTSLQQQFANQPSLPLAATMLVVNGTAGAAWRSSRRTTLTLQLGAVHSRSFDTQPGSTIPTIPTQTVVTAAPGLTHAIDRRLTMEAFATIIDTDVRGAPLANDQTPTLANGQTRNLNLLSIQPQVGIREERAHQHQLHLAVGIAYTVALQGDTNLTSYPVPLFQIDLNSVLQRTRTAVVRSSLGAGTTAFVDPVLGASVTRGIAQVGIDTQLGPWSVGAFCAFTTDVFGRLPALAPGEGSPDETAVLSEIHVRYRSSRRLIAEFGGQYTERAPRLGAPDFVWHNRELWLFLNLTASSLPSSTRS